MDLYPAIDIRGGGAVRLVQGDFDRQSEYGDPVELAQRFAAAGARWLHVVDLDAARSGDPVNRATVLAIAASVDVPVQVGGGVRTKDDVEELLAGGVRRVILGTVVLDGLDLTRALAEEFPGQVAVGIDYHLGADGTTEVAVRGWEQRSGRTVNQVLDDLDGAGVAAVIVTSIARDGMLAGPDVDGLRQVLASTKIPVIASGGVASTGDVETLARVRVPVPVSGGGVGSGAGPGSGDGRERRLTGVITGRALVDGRLTVEEGVAACAQYG
jgi:phosphoribosylformimino-5-aminoimidazole carboxamide ribotide isomerase